MAKRLTDTEKWNDDWYISLPNDYRIIWQWLLDNCNHAGICKRSIRLLNLMCNTDIDENKLVEVMEGRVIISGNNWFIPKFLKFQYTGLQSNKPVIVSVVRELEKQNLVSLIPESFGNDYLIIKDKDKDKDKDSLNAKKNKNGKSSGNFKAQGEELFAARLAKRV
ncbi:MAG TPA: hypothetical protein PKV73_01330 [Agriterribacter sp.]|nr:hypothetical protein [Agriterribacter sp.]